MSDFETHPIGTGEVLKAMAGLIRTMPDTPNTQPFKLFASGPAVEQRYRELFGDQFEIVRTDRT